MDIKKARKLLGKTGKNLTDEQIIDYKDTAEMLANLMIDLYFSMSPKERAKYAKKGEKITNSLKD